MDSKTFFPGYTPSHEDLDKEKSQPRNLLANKETNTNSRKDPTMSDTWSKLLFNNVLIHNTICL